MKKAIFAVSIVLLALLAVTCDSGILPTNAAPALGTNDEPGYVTLNIGLSANTARAMSVTQAEATVDYYEVVFKTASVTVRSVKQIANASTWPTDWYITVPAVDYDGETNVAVMFAGKKGATPGDDNILLLIGELAIDLSSKGPGDSTGIQFTINPIRSGVGTTTGESFKLTGVLSSSTPVSATIGGTVYPAFVIHQAIATATYTFNITGGHFKRAVLEKAPTIEDDDVESSGLELSDIAFGPKAVHVPIGNVDTVTPTNTGTSAVFDILIDASGVEEGFVKIFLKIPVYAINKHATTSGPFSSDTAIEWWIQGGLDNEDLDEGTDGSTGGAVLLLIDDGNDDNNPTTVGPGVGP